MKKAENLNEAQKPNLRLGAVISRYSDADIFRFSDGWWITTYSKEQKRFIKLIGSFKTKDEARAEIRSLNGLRYSALCRWGILAPKPNRSTNAQPTTKVQ